MTQREDSQRQEQHPATESGPRVLLVDDAAAIRNAVRGVLEDAGIEVVGEATDGLQGVALASSLRAFVDPSLVRETRCYSEEPRRVSPDVEEVPNT